MSKAEDQVDEIIDGLEDKKVGFIWRSACNSATAFLRTWPLGVDGRQMALAAARGGKSASKNGLVLARHAAVAVADLAKKIKRQGARQLIHDFISFVVLLGLWAARIAATVLPHVPLRRQRKLNLKQVFGFPA